MNITPYNMNLARKKARHTVAQASVEIGCSQNIISNIQKHGVLPKQKPVQDAVRSYIDKYLGGK